MRKPSEKVRTLFTNSWPGKKSKYEYSAAAAQAFPLTTEEKACPPEFWPRLSARLCHAQHSSAQCSPWLLLLVRSETVCEVNLITFFGQPKRPTYSLPLCCLTRQLAAARTHSSPDWLRIASVAPFILFGCGGGVMQ